MDLDKGPKRIPPTSEDDLKGGGSQGISSLAICFPGHVYCCCGVFDSKLFLSMSRLRVQCESFERHSHLTFYTFHNTCHMWWNHMCHALILHECSPTLPSQNCTSKGIGRQGVVLIHGNSLQKEPLPCRHMPLLVQLRPSTPHFNPFRGPSGPDRRLPASSA